MALQQIKSTRVAAVIPRQKEIQTKHPNSSERSLKSLLARPVNGIVPKQDKQGVLPAAADVEKTAPPGRFALKRKECERTAATRVQCLAQLPPLAWRGWAIVKSGSKSFDGPKLISIIGSTGSIGTQVKYLFKVAAQAEMKLFIN